MSKVLISRDGSLLAVETLSPEIRRILESQLSYMRRTALRGPRARFSSSKSQITPINCYLYSKNERAGLSERLIAAAGFLPRIVTALREAGYQPAVRTLRNDRSESAYEPDWDRLRNVEFRWKQREVLQKLLACDYGQVRCPTGYGKSFLIACLCQLLPKAKFAVTTHSLDVLDQLHHDLAKKLPSVGLYSSRSKREGRRVTCYGGKSLQHCGAPVDVLVVDEPHEFGTDDYMEKLAAPSFRYAKRWGFSANVGDRFDNADMEIEGSLGPCIIDLPYADCVKHGCVVPIEICWVAVPSDYDPGAGYDDPTQSARHSIWRNPYRNGVIAECARRFGEDEQVLITVETIEHAMYLKRELPEFTLCYSSQGLSERDRRSYVRDGFISATEPEMTLERRQALKRSFEEGSLKKVIANTVWKRGVDFRRLQVLIRADAASSVIADTQIPGRTSRVCVETDKQSALVIDFTDKFSERYRRKASERRSHYTKLGWQQLSGLPGVGRVSTIQGTGHG